jgi:hypothetical protein
MPPSERSLGINSVNFETSDQRRKAVSLGPNNAALESNVNNTNAKIKLTARLCT